MDYPKFIVSNQKEEFISIQRVKGGFCTYVINIISTVILLPSADSFKKGCYQQQGKVWLTACSSLPRKKVWFCELIIPTWS